MNTKKLLDVIAQIRADLITIESMVEGDKPKKPVGKLRFLQPDKRDDGVISYGNGRMLHPDQNS